MERRHYTILLALLFIANIFFIKTNAVTEIDAIIGEALYSLHDQGITTFFTFIGMLGSTIGIISILFIFMGVFAFIEKSFVSSGMLFLTVLLGNIANKLVKAVIGRERPTFPEHIEDGYSFPSGHVMVGLLLFGMIAYMFMKKTNDKKMKQMILFCTGILVIIIGLSRLVEGEHFLTDVIGGILAGSLMLIGMMHIDGFIHKMLERRKVKGDVAV